MAGVTAVRDPNHGIAFQLYTEVTAKDEWRQCQEEAKALKPGSGFERGQIKISPNHQVETEKDNHPAGLIDRKLHGARPDRGN